MFCIVTFGTTQIVVAVKVHFIKYALKNILNACEKPLHLKEMDLFLNIATKNLLCAPTCRYFMRNKNIQIYFYKLTLTFWFLKVH